MRACQSRLAALPQAVPARTGPPRSYWWPPRRRTLRQWNREGESNDDYALAGVAAAGYTTTPPDAAQPTADCVWASTHTRAATQQGGRADERRRVAE